MILLFTLLVWGCGNSFEETINPGTPGPAPAGTATIRLLSVLERAVPAAINEIRLSGYSASGQRVYGPETKAKSASLDFTSVPVAVTTVRIDYLAQGETLHIALVNVALVAGEVYIISDPDFDRLEDLVARLRIAPLNLTLSDGLTQQYTVFGILEDGTEIALTENVTWVSSNPTAATIDPNTGLATAEAPGQTTISATFDALSISTNLTVTDAAVTGLSITPAEAEVPLGSEQQFVATATLSDGSTTDVSATAAWSASDNAVATDPVNGLAATVGQGETTISATLAGVTAEATLTVTPAVITGLVIDQGDVTALPGAVRRFTASAVYSDGTRQDVTDQATWAAGAGLTIEQDGEATVSGTVGENSTVDATLPETDFTDSVGVYIRRYVYVSTNRHGDVAQQATITPGIFTYTASDTDGSLSEVSDSFISLENPELDYAELVIGGVTHPSGRIVYFVTSSGANSFYQSRSSNYGRLLVYDVDLETGRLSLRQEFSLGDGGSDADIDPSGRYLAVGTNNEGGKVRMYTLDPDDGEPTLLDTEGGLGGEASSNPLQQLAFSRTLPYLYVTSNDGGFRPQAGLFPLVFGPTGLDRATGANMNPFKSEGYNFIGGVSVHPFLNFLFTSSTSSSGGFVSGVRADAVDGKLTEANRLTASAINAARSTVSWSGTDLYVAGLASGPAVRHYRIDQSNAEITFVDADLLNGHICAGVAIDGTDRFVYGVSTYYDNFGNPRPGGLHTFTRDLGTGELTQTQELGVSGREIVTSP